MQGSAWMVGMRWTIRGIGLVSTVILARLLVPADFGLVAMATIALGLIETLFDFSVDLALIQMSHATRRHFDTAWTIKVVQSFLIAAVMALSAPFAADYFKDPRVVSLIQFLAVGVAVRGFENIGVVAFRKELHFSREFSFLVAKKLITFCVTIGLAWYLRDYWALAGGIFGGYLLGTVLSYLMHPYRPKPSLAALSEIWSFSQWMVLVRIGHYGSLKSDQLIIGGYTSAGDMGFYSVSSEVAELPTTELISPMSRALFPGFAKLKEHPERLNHAFLNVLGFLATVSVPAGLGIAVVARDLVAVVLGEKWLPIVLVMQCLAVNGSLRALYGQVGNLIIVLGKVKVAATISWVRTILLILASLFAVQEYGIFGVAVARITITGIFLFVFFSYLTSLTGLSWRSIGERLWRPVVAGLSMVAILMWVNPYLPDQDIWALVSSVLIGIACYSAVLSGLWALSGFPNGPEALILGMVKSKIQREPAE